MILCKSIITLFLLMFVVSIINSFIITRKMWLKDKSIKPQVVLLIFFILIILHFAIDEPWK